MATAAATPSTVTATMGGVADAVHSRLAFIVNGSTRTVAAEGDADYTPQGKTAIVPAAVVVADFPALATTAQSIAVIYAYNQQTAVRWWGADLEGYWSHLYGDMDTLLAIAKTEYAAVRAECEDLDVAEVQRYHALGGPKFAAILSLAWRQALGSMMLVWNPVGFRTGKPEMQIYLKEISTGDDIQTLDVIYPAAPLYVYSNPDLVYELLVPLLEYANNATNVSYNKPYAPHHLGTDA